MFIPTVIMALLAIILLYLGYRTGEGQHIIGLKRGTTMIIEILPLLVCAFVVAGMAQVLLPQETLAKWIGAESGLKGILLSSSCRPDSSGIFREQSHIMNSFPKHVQNLVDEERI